MVIASLGACASVPNAQVHYYPVKASVKLSTIETVSCDAAKQNLIVASTTTVTVTGAADRSVAPVTVSFNDVGGTGADLDQTFTFTDDGRLKGVNVSSTGEGEAIVKSAVTLATAALAVGAAGGAPVPASSDCTQIDSLGGGKPLSLTFSKTLKFGQVDTITVGDLDADDQAKVALAVVPKLPVPSLAVSGADTPIIPAATGTVGPDDIGLQLSNVRSVTLAVTVGSAPAWTQDVLVPTKGVFSLPIPKSKLFGKEGFTLALSDVGTITSIGYSKLSGSSSALNAANSIASLQPTPADQAADIKAQADIMAQQQRLVRCKANPAACT